MKSFFSTGLGVLRQKKWPAPEWLIVIGILLLGLLDFGLLLPHLGFYLDDWYTIWFAKTIGVSSYPQIYAEDRPFLGYFYVVAVTLLGKTPIPWQIFAIFCRCLAALAAWWALRQVWPKSPEATAMVALVFLVYPGFKQQWISVSFSPWFLFLAFFLFSLGGMVVSIRKRRWYLPLTILWVAVSVYTMLTTEYYFGLELLRPVIIWICLAPLVVSQRDRLKKTLLYWMPYLGGLLAYWVWRTFFFVSSHYSLEATGDFRSNPLGTLFNLAKSLAVDAYNATWVAWSQAVKITVPFDLSQHVYATFWGLVILAGVLTLGLLIGLFFMLRARGNLAEPKKDSLQILLTGVFALLVGGIPFWAAGLNVLTKFPWDRFTLALILGASLLVVGLVELIFRSIYPKAIILAVLIAVATGANFQLQRDYRDQWVGFQELFWELSWRAPSIRPGTILVMHNLNQPYFSENSLTAALNWVYAPNIQTKTFSYFAFFSDAANGEELFSMPSGTAIIHSLRTFTFTGSSSQVVGVYYAPGDCVHVLDQSGETMPMMPADLRPVIHLSNTGLIDSTSKAKADLPQVLFGAEPSHSWCYYYEKAELARQEGDWQQVVTLGQQALSKNLKPIWLSEWLPFIEGYARTGNYAEAQTLTLNSYSKFSLMQSGVCETWERIKMNAAPTADQLQIIQSVLQTANCS